MDDLQKFTFAAAVTNSALFLAGCFTAGFLTHNEFAWKMALTSLGLCFLSWACQYGQMQSGAPGWMGPVCLTLVSTSIIAGVLAGISLLAV